MSRLRTGSSWTGQTSRSTDVSTRPSLDALIDGLEGTFPPPDEAALALTLITLLAEGAPVSTERLADESGRRADDVAQRLHAWPNVDLDDDGRVVAFAGLSLRPTAHRLVIGDRTLFTWCAWDTLFLPELLGQDARVQSACPATGRPVRLALSPQQVVDVQPATAVVSIVVPQSVGDIRSTFCCNVAFYSSREAAAAWMAGRPDATRLTVRQAHELGRRTNERFFKHPQRPTAGAAHDR